MSEQRIVVEKPDYEAAWAAFEKGISTKGLDWLDIVPRIVDAALADARIVELPDMEKLREALDLLRVNSLVDSVANRWLTRPPVQAVLDAARWVLSLESE